MKQKTAKDRFRRALRSIAVWCRNHRHMKVQEQWATLRRKLLGHFGYYGVIGNLEALQDFRHWAICAWRKWLSRRSQRALIPWESMRKLLERYPLPQPRIRASHVT